MAVAPRRSVRDRPPWGRGGARRALLVIAALFLVAVVVLAGAALLWSGVMLRSDAAALARLKLDPFAGSIQRVRALGPDGSPITLAIRDGRLEAREALRPGEWISLDVVVRRPGWLAWDCGAPAPAWRTSRVHSWAAS